MLALRRQGGQITLSTDEPEPTPKEGEAIVRVRIAAVTGLDLAVAHGVLAFEGTLGHSFVGTVESMPGGRRKLAGARVVVASVCACGRCDRCAAGFTAHCRERTIPGVIGRDGGFAERVRLQLQNTKRDFRFVPEVDPADEWLIKRLPVQVIPSPHSVASQ